MAKLWAIIKREYLERVRSKWFIIATLVAPFVFGAMMIIPIYLAAKSKSGSEVYNTVIIDATKSGFGQRVADVISGGSSGKSGTINTLRVGGPSPVVRVVDPSALAPAESLATKQVMRNLYSGYLVVDERTVAGEAVRYAGRNATSIPDMERLQGAVKEAVLGKRLEDAGLNSTKTRDLTFIPLGFSTERITENGRGGSGMASVVFGYVIALLLYMSIMLYGQNVMGGVLEEKTSRVAEVVMSSVPTDTLLAGKVLGVGAVGLTQQALWVLTTLAMVQLRAPIMARLGIPNAQFTLPSISLGAGLLFMLFFVLGFTFYASLFAAVGSSVNTEQEAKQAATPVILLNIGSIIFISPVLLNPTGTLATVLSLLPFSAPIMMPLRMALTAIPLWQLGASIASLVLSCVLVVWIASRIYRIGLLMYGKKPTWRELARWVSYSG
jgi:ABC-2 type transport system permease protein